MSEETPPWTDDGLLSGVALRQDRIDHPDNYPDPPKRKRLSKPAYVRQGAACTQAESSFSSNVHTLETNPPCTGEWLQTKANDDDRFSIEPVTRQESTFRHSGWSARRLQVWQALRRIQAPTKTLEAFANCGSGLWLQRNATGDDLHLACNKCHNRACIPCQTDRAFLIRTKLTHFLADRTVRFLTLTLRHSRTSLIDQIKRLYRSFSTLRRRDSWKAHVQGGVAFLETKISDRDGLWHVHLHVLIEGSFWDAKEISHEWLSVTGDSSIIDIRAIRDPKHVAAYVTKYVTKPADASVFNNPDNLDELLVSLRGTRLALPFGTFRHLRLMEKPDRDQSWITVGNLESLARQAREGDPQATRWMEAATRKWPQLANIFSPRADTS